MKTELTISTDPINEAALAESRAMGDGMGAVVCFLGVVRGSEGDDAITAIDYEAFEPMARRQFELLFDELGQRWPVESVRLVHRIGVVPVNEPSLWVEVVAPHRAEAFDACQFLISEMKQKVPIWKKPLPA
ncbi:uncharacterized protein METZ01_LOCUS225381 [marine metagenome]|uniref:Molybdenum cofactor biosynthesis protein MoaE n=1 Tax=marine metagenome TaxID=408172 RepID=A0A382GD54_9ZZZZ